MFPNEDTLCGISFTIKSVASLGETMIGLVFRLIVRLSIRMRVCNSLDKAYGPSPRTWLYGRDMHKIQQMVSG